MYFCQVDDFLQALVSYDKEHVPEVCLTAVKQKYLRNPEFHPDLVRTKSTAAAGLCAWTINIVRYYEVRQYLHTPNRISHVPARTFFSSLWSFFHIMPPIFFFLQIYCEVIPKRQALSQANADLDTATSKMLAVQKKLAVSAMLHLIKSSLKASFS